MTPAEQEFLFVLVREVIVHGDNSDEIASNRNGSEYLAALCSLGYLQGTVLSDRAFLLFFDTFETISCPEEIQDLIDSLELESIHWRRPKGVIEERMEQDGLSYRNLKTVFIRDGARISTWYHELGHITYGCIKHNTQTRILLQQLEAEAQTAYPVVSSDDMGLVLDPRTHEILSAEPGLYVLINGQFHGLDHSGDGADGIADERWASLFKEYYTGGQLTEGVRTKIEEILSALGSSMPKPLNPCDPSS